MITVETIDGVHRYTDDETAEKFPGITSICSLLDKSDALIPWAIKKCLESLNRGEDQVIASYAWKAERNKAAGEGKEKHNVVSQFLLEWMKNGEPPEIQGEMTANEMGIALHSFAKWAESVGFIPLETETPTVCQKHKYGATLDAVGKVRGKMSIVEIKTGKGIYLEHFLQVVGQKISFEETEKRTKKNPRKIQSLWILKLGGDKPFQAYEVKRSHWKLLFKGVIALRGLWDIREKFPEILSGRKVVHL